MGEARRRCATAKAEGSTRLVFTGLMLTELPEETWELVNLTELWCCRNQLTSLEGLDKLVNLTGLYCNTNPLSSLEGLEKLVNLTTLYCGGNQLTSLEGLDQLLNLTVLSCRGNQLPSLDGLSAQEAVAQVKREMAAALVKGAQDLGGDGDGGGGGSGDGGGGGGGGDDFGSTPSARSRTGSDEMTPLGD